MMVAGSNPSDPWVASHSLHSPTPAPTPPWLLVLASVVLGAAGPILRLVGDGFGEWALALGLLSMVWAAALRYRPEGIIGWVLVLGLALSAPLVTWSTMGRAPTVIAFAGVFTAWAASVSGTDAGKADRHRWAGLALAPLVAAQLVWLRAQGRLPSVVLLVAAALIVVAYRAWPSRAIALERVVRTSLVRIVSALGMVLLFVVAVVFLYLPGSVGAVLQRRRRHGSRESYWTPRTDDACRIEVSAARPFRSASPEVRRRSHLLGALALSVAVVASVVVVTGLRAPWVRPTGEATHRARPGHSDPNVFERGRSVRFSSLPAYRGVPFADALKAEQDSFTSGHLVPSTVGGYDVSDFSGAYTNVHNGARRSLEATDCATCREFTVWLAGGSAAFGLGQRDDHTIASELVRVARADGVTLNVVNMGVPGWTLHQEIQKVLDRLKHAEPPDIVVFYDGFNDVVGTVVDSALNGVHPDEPALLRNDQILEYSERDIDPNTVGTPTDIGLLAARKYRAAQSSVRDELEAVGVDSLHVFQPDALTSTDQYEQVVAEYGYEALDIGYFNQALESASRDLHPEVINLRHSLDSGAPVFADLVHTNESAARQIAELLYPSIMGVLQAD